jgi:hypothetical protein
VATFVREEMKRADRVGDNSRGTENPLLGLVARRIVDLVLIVARKGGARESQRKLPPASLNRISAWFATTPGN